MSELELELDLQVTREESGLHIHIMWFCNKCVPRVREMMKEAKLLREATTERRKKKDY